MPAQGGLSIPGPAGALQRAQAAGLQPPPLHDLGLHNESLLTASQQQAYEHMHPDFLSPAWQSAMEALDLLCFSGEHRSGQLYSNTGEGGVSATCQAAPYSFCLNSITYCRCAAETSPMLQSHVKKVMLCPTSCKLPKVSGNRNLEG